jgi:hypothetical protein
VGRQSRIAVHSGRMWVFWPIRIRRLVSGLQPSNSFLRRYLGLRPRCGDSRGCSDSGLLARLGCCG